jgi:hypothetical protein
MEPSAIISAFEKLFQSPSDGWILPEICYVDTSTLQQIWESIYAKTEFSWDLWAVPRGGINGFVQRIRTDNTNSYVQRIIINSTSANAGTLIHEMLHVNASPHWVNSVPTIIDEGATDFIKEYIMRSHRLPVVNSYQHELEFIKRCCISIDMLALAYFKGQNVDMVLDQIKKQLRDHE